MPSRRDVLATAGTALAGTVGLAGCAAPVGSIPRIDDRSCPPLDRAGYGENYVCSHTDSAGGIDVGVSPDTVSNERESLEAVTIRLENNTGERVGIDMTRWELYRTTGYGWAEREVDVVGDEELQVMDPGHSWSWSGIDAMFELGATGKTPLGLYAAVTTVGVGGQYTGDTRQAGRPVDCLFLFRVARSV